MKVIEENESFFKRIFCKKTLVQGIKFGLVGVLNSSVDYSVSWILVRLLGVNPVFAKVISYSAGVINSYFFNSRWTFKKQSKDSPKQKVRFILVNIVACAFAALTVKVCLEQFAIVYEIANLISIIVTVGINFIGSKFFVFTEKE